MAAVTQIGGAIPQVGPRTPTPAFTPRDNYGNPVLPGMTLVRDQFGMLVAVPDPALAPPPPSPTPTGPTDGRPVRRPKESSGSYNRRLAEWQAQQDAQQRAVAEQQRVRDFDAAMLLNFLGQDLTDIGMGAPTDTMFDPTLSRYGFQAEQFARGLRRQQLNPLLDSLMPGVFGQQAQGMGMPMMGQMPQVPQSLFMQQPQMNSLYGTPQMMQMPSMLY